MRFCPKDGTATVEGNVLFADPTVLRPGDVINGRYRITELIGRGGFGAVYSGHHTGTHQQVALKLLMPSDDDPRTDVRRFHQEAQLTASLKHPNTVRVFDVGQTQHGALFLAMELLHGQTLEDRLQELDKRKVALSQDETLDMAIQVLKALNEAHGKGLVHRDLKPANIMITELDGERLFKVLDFGIARRQGSTLTGQGRALGTPAYMSPEQCMGDDVDGRADLYALGCMMFRCLTRRTPYEADTVFAMMQGHALAPIPNVAKESKLPIAPGLKSAIDKVLAKEPEQRFQTAREMRDHLELVRKSLLPDDEAPTMAMVTQEPPTRALRPSGQMPVQALPVSGPKPVAKPAPAAAPTRPDGHSRAASAPARLVVQVDAPAAKSTGAQKAVAPKPAAAEDYEPLPGAAGRPAWLPYAIGGAVVAALAIGSFLAWR